MIFTTRLKIWTLITHACILIGMGHGGAILGIIEFFWLATVFQNQNVTNGNGHVSLLTLQIVACLCLLGQIATVISISLRNSSISKGLTIVGLGILWASVFAYAYGIRNDSYAHLSILSCLPFAYCTFRTLLGRHVQLLWEKIYERL